VSRVDDIGRGTVYDTTSSSQTENIKAEIGCLLCDSRESRNDWVQGVEDSRRTWEGNTLKQHLACDSIKTAAESWATFPFSKTVGTLFARLGWYIRNAGATKNSLSSDHPLLCVQTWKLFSTPPPRGQEPRGNSARFLQRRRLDSGPWTAAFLAALRGKVGLG